MNDAPEWISQTLKKMFDAIECEIGTLSDSDADQDRRAALRMAQDHIESADCELEDAGWAD